LASVVPVQKSPYFEGELSIKREKVQGVTENVIEFHAGAATEGRPYSTFGRAQGA